MGRGAAGSAEGEGVIRLPDAEGEGTLAIAGLGPAGESRDALGQGSFRTVLGTSGRGASSATRASISCRLLSLAFARTDWWFSTVRCRPSRRTEVRLREPEARSSRIRGKRRQARAASMRLQA